MFLINFFFAFNEVTFNWLLNYPRMCSPQQSKIDDSSINIVWNRVFAEFPDSVGDPVAADVWQRTEGSAINC